TTDVALSVCRATLARDRCEAREHVSLLPDLAEDLRARVPGNVVRDGEGPKRPRALRVHAPLRDDLPDEVGELLVQPDVLRQQGTTRAGGEAVLILRHRGAERCRQLRGALVVVIVLAQG